MRRKFKLVSMLMALCVLLSMTMVVYAAEGRMSFTDLSTPAGEEFQVTINMTADVGIGTIDVVFDYDNTVIEFLSGDNLTASNSQLTYYTESDGSQTTIKTIATFMALKNTETKITIAELTVTDVNGDVIDTIEGNSTITIEGGTEVEASVVETSTVDAVTVNGVAYSLSATFDETLLPEGFTLTETDYNGTTISVGENTTSGFVLAYLVDAAGEGDFFAYDATDTSFSPYVEVTISDTTNIVFTDQEMESTLPSQYVETTLTISGYVFPTWEDTENAGLYLINAINSSGELCLYQYDTVDQTYQRFVLSTVDVEEVAESDSDTANDVLDLVTANIMYVAIIVAALLFVLLLFIIILAVKLGNRNSELDDLYEEYGYDDDTLDVKAEPKKKEAKKKEVKSKDTTNNMPVEKEPVVKKDDKKKKKTAEQAYYEDVEEFDDYDDEFDDYDDDEFDDYDDDEFDDYDDDEFDDYDNDEFDDYDDDEFDDYDDDDDFDDEFDDYDDSDDFEEVEPKTKLRSFRDRKASSAKRKDNSDDDIDFINL